VDNFGISGQKILQVLISSAALNQKQIADSTGLSERTIKYALKRLVSEKIVTEKSDISDMRRKIYFLRRVCYG